MPSQLPFLEQDQEALHSISLASKGADRKILKIPNLLMDHFLDTSTDPKTKSIS